MRWMTCVYVEQQRAKNNTHRNESKRLIPVYKPNRKKENNKKAVIQNLNLNFSFSYSQWIWLKAIKSLTKADAYEQKGEENKAQDEIEME